MAEFIVMLNESMPESERFIMERLDDDDTHMYVLPHAAAMIAELSKRNFSNLRPTRRQRKVAAVKSNFQDA